MNPGRRIWLRPIAGLCLIPAAALAETHAPLRPGLTEDPVLRDLVAEAMAKRPEVARARAQIAAEAERVPQARTLPDPTLSLGIQNDGFGGIEIGKMPSSWLYIVAAQTIPWPGKRGLRSELAGLDGKAADADLRRVLLRAAADMERAYLDVLLVRARLGLLGQTETLWKQAEAAARARYEAGEAAQSDLLRAQLERGRLRQQRFFLEADERRRLVVLNRLRGRGASDSVPADRSLADLPDPDPVDVEQAVAAAVAVSPEMEKAQLSARSADRRVDLAKKERWPDLTVSAGVMPRGGDFPTMWQAGIAFNVPLWSLGKQARAMAENRSRGQAVRSGAEAIRQVLAQRVRERAELLASLVATRRLYRSAILPGSQAVVKSALLQYQVGRAPFASVLDALSGYLADENGFLESVATAQRIAIAEREVSLESPAGPEAAAPASSPATGAAADEQAGGEGAAATMSRM